MQTLHLLWDFGSGSVKSRMRDRPKTFFPQPNLLRKGFFSTWGRRRRHRRLRLEAFLRRRRTIWKVRMQNGSSSCFSWNLVWRKTVFKVLLFSCFVLNFKDLFFLWMAAAAELLNLLLPHLTDLKWWLSLLAAIEGFIPMVKLCKGVKWGFHPTRKCLNQQMWPQSLLLLLVKN